MALKEYKPGHAFPGVIERQGTKSGEVGKRLRSERYGDLMFTPSSLWARHWGDATWMLARRGGRESEKGVSAGAWSRSTGAG